MARRLSIERRQKRYRQYAAHLRKRSRVRQAVLYWWSPLLLIAIVGLLLTTTLWQSIYRWTPLYRQPQEKRAHYLPIAGLRLVHASSDAIAAIIRTGNINRQTLSLSDDDVGISLQAPLIEPRYPSTSSFNPLILVGQTKRSTLSTLHLPQKIYRHTPPPPRTITVTCDTALTQSNYSPTFERWTKEELANMQPGTARYQVTLDAKGLPILILRLAPIGQETVDLRKIRTILEQTRGKHAVTGELTITW